jgi:hypothetical protein
MVARNRARAGQASVELVAALPALALAAALALQLLLVGYSMTIADGAAEAGALAGVAGRDAKRAAVEALPGWARERSHVSADGGRVKVELRPPAPLAAIAKELTVSSEAWSRSPRGGG